MDRINGAGHVNRRFVSEDAGANRPPTEITDDWLNGQQEELVAVIEGVGMVLSSLDNTQLRQAITKMIQAGQRAVIIDAAVFSGAVVGTGKAVYWDSANNRFDLALADGSVKQSAVGFADVPNAKVYCFGSAPLFAGLTPGARYYLDGAAAGGVTSVMPAANAVFVGIAKSAAEVFVDIDAQAGASVKQIQSLNVTVAGNALTIVLNPSSLDFRPSAAAGGTPNTRQFSALTLTVPNGATLGTESGKSARIAVLAIDVAGTVELAVVNVAGNVNLDETGLISTTALTGASNGVNIIYSTAARVAVPYRVCGHFDLNQVVAGAWAAAPTLVQGAGGLAAPFIGRSMVRVINANGYGGAGTAIRRFSTVLANHGNDVSYADSASLGASFTINAAGVYAITYVECYSNSNNRVGISLNSSQLTTGIDSINAADRIVSTEAYLPNYCHACTWVGFLPAGAVIRPHGEGQPAGSVPPSFTISRVF